jgi:phage terminase large subunit-like protein
MKECPWWIYDLPLKWAKLLVQGFFNGDGSRGSQAIYRASSVSYPLLFQLRALTNRLGCPFNIGKGSMRPLSVNPLYETSMPRAFGPLVFDTDEPISFTESVIENEVLLRPVRKVEKFTGEYRVFNLSMDIGEHSYENSSIISHNCDYRNSIVFPQHRESIKHKVYAEILPMLEEDGQALSIATPHHQLDIVASLRINPAWESYIYAVGVDDDPYKPMWPSRWPRKSLMALAEEIGMTEYNRAYRCISVNSAVELIQPEHIRYYDTDKLGNPWRLVCIQAYDLAITQKKGSSYFAGVTVLLDTELGEIYVADAWHDKLSFAEQALAVKDAAATWQPNVIVIEETGYQSALRSYLNDIADEMLPIIPISPMGKSKELRLTETLPMFERGKIYFNPRLDPKINLDLDERGDLVSQLLTFMTTDDRDLSDAFAYAIRAARAHTVEGDDEREWLGDSGGMNSRLSIIG